MCNPFWETFKDAVCLVMFGLLIEPASVAEGAACDQAADANNSLFVSHAHDGPRGLNDVDQVRAFDGRQARALKQQSVGFAGVLVVISIQQPTSHFIYSHFSPSHS